MDSKGENRFDSDSQHEVSCLSPQISYQSATLSAHHLADTAAPADPTLPKWRAHSRCFMSFKTKTITSTQMLSLYRPQGEPPQWGIFFLISLSSAKHSTSAFRWPLQHAVVTRSLTHCEPAQADDESGSYLWLDAPTDPDVEIPDYSGRILCKALRLGGTSCSSYFVRFCTAHRQKGVGQCTKACSRSCCEQEASTCENASSEGASINLLETPSSIVDSLRLASGCNTTSAGSLHPYSITSSDTQCTGA